MSDSFVIFAFIAVIIFLVINIPSNEEESKEPQEKDEFLEKSPIPISSNIPASPVIPPLPKFKLLPLNNPLQLPRMSNLRKSPKNFLNLYADMSLLIVIPKLAYLFRKMKPLMLKALNRVLSLHWFKTPKIPTTTVPSA